MNFLAEILLYLAYPLAIFVNFPGLAFLPSFLFLAAFIKKRRLFILPAVAGWALYGLYEYYMHTWMLNVIAPIRLDLILWVPVLYPITILGVWFLMKKG